MAHKQQADFCQSVKNKFSDYFRERIVLDIGSLDINGNNQFLFEDCLYLGIDVAEGRNVDFVCKGHELQLPDSSFDVIISTECFEHDQYYEQTIKNIYRLLKPGGLFIFTCATTGRPEHGTRRTSPTDAPLIQSLGDWGDYYKNLEESDIRNVLDIDALFSDYEFSIGKETFDLYFWGIKSGDIRFRSNYSNQHQVSQVHAMEAKLKETKEDVERIKSALHTCETEIRTIRASKSWQLTRPLRGIARLIRGEIPLSHLGISDFRTALARTTNALAYLRRGDFSGLYQRVSTGVQHSPIDAIKLKENLPRETVNWGILTTPHTLFIAHLVAQRLRHHGWKVEISQTASNNFSHDWYIVLCPQMFKTLPPAHKRICFQLEQSISSRWFTKKYFRTLENSLAVLDYNLTNIDFLSKNGICYPQVFYVPLGACTDYGEPISSDDKCYDVLFYGDYKSSPRRRKLLGELKAAFNVHIASEIFGEEIRDLIKRSRVVVNIHYYENALLETPRITECLSLGTPVVSELSKDFDEYPEFREAIYFFEEGSSSKMIEAVRKALDKSHETDQFSHVQQSSNARFSFMFDRFLVAMGFLPPEEIIVNPLPFDLSSRQVALSLPETIDRRAAFMQVKPDKCSLFDCIRFRPGWAGCALSYSILAKTALEQKIDFLTIMEDDVLLPANFDTTIKIVEEYLTEHNHNWDIFAGLIALHHRDTEILSVERYKGMTFITINKMTSMVYNIYRTKALKLLSNWPYKNLNADTNTIDRFIENQDDLKIVTTIPFLVGHHEELHSTLWGFKNTRYLDLIQSSQESLQKKVDLFLKNT